MALIRCNECGHMISDKASKCPKCGTPVWVETPQRQDDRFASASNSPRDIMVETKSSNKTLLYVIIGILVAALGILGYFLLKSDKNDNQTNNSSEAHVGKFDGHYEWVGTVGAYGANMKLDINNGHATGLYHYDFQKEGVNLSLSGECKEDGTLTLEETTPAGRNSGRFVGKLVGGSFNGTFYNLIKGTTFPFSLSLETDANPMGVSGEDYANGYESVLSERKLSYSDLSNKTTKELEIMRNSIYARYGYRFKRDDLFNHFSQYSWYNPTTSDMSTVYNSMSDIEKYNIDFIKKHE